MIRTLIATSMALALSCFTIQSQTHEFAKVEVSKSFNDASFYISRTDTVILQFTTGETFYIYGIKSQQVGLYADTISQMLRYLAADLQVAENLPDDATRALYLYNGKFKRRIKVEDPEYTQHTFDVQEEIFRMQHQLGKLKIQIISLPHFMEIVVYGKDYNSIISLIQSELFERYITELKNPKYFSEKSLVAKNTTQTRLTYVNNELVVKSNYLRKTVIQGEFNFGPMFIAGDIGAMLGIDIYYTKFNKMNKSSQRMGLNLTTGTFYSVNQDSRNGRLGVVKVYNLHYMKKHTNTSLWSGLQVGLVNVTGQRSPLFVPRLSFLNEINIFSWSWDLYLGDFTGRGEGLVSGFTFRFPI
jgi:hypothetical protein